MFGINGSHVIRECVRMVLIPAATDIVDQVGNSGKGSALSELIGSLMADAGASARANWMAENEEKIAELNLSVKTSVDTATRVQATRINARLEALVPDAALELSPTVPDWTPKGEPSVTAAVSVGGIVNDVGRQGHGIQRAVMIAMFQALVPDVELTTASHELVDGETTAEDAARLADELAKLPALIVAIEEPEIYQHPIRARAFARVLADLAEKTNVQVLLATHSPYFVRPQQFASLRRFWLTSGETSVTDTDLNSVALAATCTEAQADKIIAKRLPNAFAEGFFADAVVLVEGDTDKVVIEAIAELLAAPLDAAGISVLDMSGKEGLAIPYAMLTALQTPSYVLVDGDSLGAARHHTTDLTKRANAHASHRRSTEAICAWLPTAAGAPAIGALPYTFEDPTVVTDQYTIWEDDIEEELSKWLSFMTALAANGFSLRDKDLLAYRVAVLEAQLVDLPDVLRRSVESIVAFRAAH